MWFLSLTLIIAYVTFLIYDNIIEELHQLVFISDKNKKNPHIVIPLKTRITVCPLTCWWPVTVQSSLPTCLSKGEAYLKAKDCPVK